MMVMEFKRQVLFNAISAVLPFASKDDTRAHLCSVLFEADGDTLNVVATDGHTLAWAKPLPDLRSPKAKASAILGADVAKGLADTVKPSRTERDDVIEIRFNDGIHYTSALGESRFGAMTANYPPFRKVVPNKVKPSVFNANPVYLERVAKACKAFVRGGRRVDRGVQVQGGGLDPIRFDYSHPDFGDLVAIVMPMRG